MICFLEDAVNAYYTSEYDVAFDCLQNIDYILREIEERDSVEQELLELVDDIVYAHRVKCYDDALLYIKMAIDIAILPSIEEYRYSEVGFKTLNAELEEHVNTTIDADNNIEHIEWDMKYRKLKGRLTKLLIADHRERFGHHSLLA